MQIIIKLPTRIHSVAADAIYGSLGTSKGRNVLLR